MKMSKEPDSPAPTEPKIENPFKPPQEPMKKICLDCLVFLDPTEAKNPFGKHYNHII